MDIPLVSLRGCGKITTTKLAMKEIFTVGHLLNTKDDLTDIKGIQNLISTARSKVSTTSVKRDSKCIKNHSWYGYSCHYIDKNSRIYRMRICEYIISPSRCVLVLRRFPKGLCIERIATPLSVASTHSLWCQRSIVSDEEDCDEDDGVRSGKLALPIFEVHVDDIGVRFQISEVQKYQLAAAYPYTD